MQILLLETRFLLFVAFKILSRGQEPSAGLDQEASQSVSL